MPFRDSSAKKRARAPDAGWTLEPHVCRHCFGRLVSQAQADGRVRYACTNCGATAEGLESSCLCACGLTLNNPAGGAPVNAGIRCVENPRLSPEYPSLYVATEAAT